MTLSILYNDQNIFKEDKNKKNEGIDNGSIFICPECHSPFVFFDKQKGEWICRECGLVIVDHELVGDIDISDSYSSLNWKRIPFFNVSDEKRKREWERLMKLDWKIRRSHKYDREKEHARKLKGFMDNMYSFISNSCYFAVDFTPTYLFKESAYREVREYFNALKTEKRVKEKNVSFRIMTTRYFISSIFYFLKKHAFLFDTKEFIKFFSSFYPHLTFSHVRKDYFKLQFLFGKVDIALSENKLELIIDTFLNHVPKVPLDPETKGEIKEKAKKIYAYLNKKKIYINSGSSQHIVMTNILYYLTRKMHQKTPHIVTRPRVQQYMGYCLTKSDQIKKIIYKINL